MEYIVSHNPSRNFSEIGKIPVTTKQEIVEMLHISKKSQREWGNKSVAERVDYLRKTYEHMSSRKGDLADILSQEMGMPKKQAMDEVEYGLGYFAGYFDIVEAALAPEIVKQTDSELHTVFYEPKGVVAAIAPWNFPTFLFVWSSIQALFAGNSVIFKTSKETILTGKMIADIMSESGLPQGVFQEIYGSGEVGDFLTDQDIDFISFTGSTEVGKMLYKKVAEKMITCTLELGGSAPGIVCKDADVDSVIESLYIMKFLNAGQVCDGLKRLIVHTSRYDEVVEKLGKLLLSKKIGEAQDKNTDIGPLVNQKQVDFLEAQLQDALSKGAKILVKNTPDTSLKGAYTSAILLGNISPDMSVWTQEVFGPLLPIISFTTIEQAIQLANDTDYGLGAYVFTENLEEFKILSRSIKSGMIQHNNLNYCQPQNPFGGYKLSGIGRENGKQGFVDTCNIKVVSQEI